MINKYTDGKLIRVDTFDLSGVGGAAKKVDLLYYNTINQEGKILKSVVHMSEIKSLNDKSQLIYDNTRLLANVYIPDGFGVDMSWTFGGEFDSGLNFSKLIKANTGDVTSYDPVTDYAPVIGNDVVMYDGWYTLVSFAPQHLDSYSGPGFVAGQWAEIGGDVMYAIIDNPSLSSDWQSIYSVPDQTVKVHHLIDSEQNTMKEEFFVLSHALSMYSDLLLKKMDGEWYTQATSIKPKIRTLQSKIEQNDYAFSQYVLNSMDYALISQLI